MIDNINKISLSGINTPSLKELVDSLLENNTVWLNAQDTDGNITLWNNAAETISGYSRQDVISKNTVWEWIYPDAGNRKKILEEVSGIPGKKQMVTDCQTEILCKNGRKKVMSWSSRKITDDHGNTSGIVTYGHDITDSKNLEQVLQDTQKMGAIGTLSSGLAHDFNNILSAVFGFAQLIKLKTSGDEKIQSYVDQLLLSSMRAKELVQQMQMFSRKKEIKKYPANVGIMIKETMKLLRASIPSSINIKTNVDSAIGNVMADQTQIHQMIINLCVNGEEAMKDGGLLSVSLKKYEGAAPASKAFMKDRDYMVLLVKDSGHGISEEVLPRIFEPYFSTREKGENRGLGLAVVNEIVKNLEGIIEIVSEPGRGSEVQVLFPIVPEHPIEMNVFSKMIPKGSETILIVDDEPNLTDVMRDIFSEHGYKIDSCTNPLEAIVMVDRDPKKYKLIITDMTMPDMNGVALSRKIYSMNRSIPVILHTGIDCTDLDLSGTAIRKILKKPMLAQNLAECMRDILGNP